RNHAAPNPVSNKPKAVLRFCEAMTQRALRAHPDPPENHPHQCKAKRAEKTRGAAAADTRCANKDTFAPNLSNSGPNGIDASTGTASVLIAFPMNANTQ